MNSQLFKGQTGARSFSRLQELGPSKHKDLLEWDCNNGFQWSQEKWKQFSPHRWFWKACSWSVLCASNWAGQRRSLKASAQLLFPICSEHWTSCLARALIADRGVCERMQQKHEDWRASAQSYQGNRKPLPVTLLQKEKISGSRTISAYPFLVTKFNKTQAPDLCVWQVRFSPCQSWQRGFTDCPCAPRAALLGPHQMLQKYCWEQRSPDRQLVWEAL